MTSSLLTRLRGIFSRFSQSHPRVLASAIVFVLLLLFFVGGELILRLEGVHPWQKVKLRIQVSPSGTFFVRHPTLGYSHIPGEFTVTLGTGYAFHVTHLPNTLRITHALDNDKGVRQKEEIWIFGCSFTHGWSLNDEETFPWVLQEWFPEYEVVNFGVSGYGTIHSLIQFRNELTMRRPKVAVLAYAAFHDSRNTFLREQRKVIAPWNKLGPLVQPYARFDGEGNLQYSMAQVEYTEFPLMRYLALVHFIEIQYNQFETRSIRSHAISEALVKEMARLANQHDVKFVVAGILSDPATLAMLHFAQENGIPSVDIAVDLGVNEHTNAPHDGHPSALANKKYADKLEAYPESGVSGR